jgi:hypothetical protein
MSRINYDKEWILTTNPGYTPNGVLQLGQLLTDYADPGSAILTETTAPIPKHTLKEEPDDQDVNYESSEPKQVAFKAWLKAISKLSPRFKINDLVQRAYRTMFEDHAISVIKFQPSKHYVKTALSLNDTSGLIPMPRYVPNTRIWVVTGLRIVGKRKRIGEGLINQATGHTGVK